MTVSEKKSRVGALAEAFTQKRGGKVVVHLRGSYGGYTWPEVCALCARIEDPGDSLKLNHFKVSSPHYDPAIMVVPHGSMRAWLAMDVDAMASKGIRGMVGVRHWRAEKESRGRTTLPRAGGYSGSGEPMLGKAEDAMMVFCADEARKGTPVSEDSLPELLLGVSIKLGCINTYTSKLYDKSTCSSRRSCAPRRWRPRPAPRRRTTCATTSASATTWTRRGACATTP
jgi:hypothetical protein